MFKKVLKLVGKAISNTFEIAIWLLGFAMIAMLVVTFLTSSTMSVHRAIVNCDKDCYEALGLESEFPYRENLVVFVKRLAVRCTYFSLTGMQHDQLWQSGWMFDGANSGDEGVILETGMSWPVPDEDFLWADLPIRSPRSEYEIGCPVDYIHNTSRTEVFSAEPENILHSGF